MFVLKINFNDKSIELQNYEFLKIDLEFKYFNLDKKYKDEREKKYILHNYGNQLFCKFRINENIRKSGIYFFVFGDNIKYVGECEDLYSRINNGYGNISPRNCYVGGQSTNCKINALINKCIHLGGTVNLYFHETYGDSYERKKIESKLIRNLDLLNSGYNGRI
jgi:hypothetical protein